MTKVMLTFVGTGKYDETVYSFCDAAPEPTPYVQHALLQLMQAGAIDFRPDIIVPLLTSSAKVDNWDSNHGKQPGLRALIEDWIDRRDYPVALEPLLLDERNDERSIWQNFGLIYERIREINNSNPSHPLTILVDVTHSFRYQPMLILALVHFARVVDGVQLYSAYYGAQAQPKTESNPQKGAIVDLSPLVELQDWVLHVHMLLNGANASGLNQFIEQKRVASAQRKDPFLTEIAKLSSVSKSWAELTQSLQLTRGPEIPQFARDSLDRLNRFMLSAHELSRQVPSLQPILHLIDQIRQETEPLAADDVIDAGINAIRWCQRNGLIQQAFTLLTELMITAVCKVGQWDLRDKHVRDVAATLLSSGSRTQRGESSERGDADDFSRVPGVNRVVDKLNAVPELFSLWHDISDVRNNLNHAGWRRDKENMRLRKFAESLLVDDVELAVQKLLQERG